MESSQSTNVTVIEPQKGWRLPELRAVWENLDLLYFLARRDVVVRYKQAVAGVFWAVLQPLVLAGVFSVFLGLLAKVQSEEGIPYPLFALSGMVMWLAFAGALQNASASTVASENLISKVYFPRILIPIASIMPSAVDFAVGLVVVLVVGLAYGFVPDLRVLAVPLIFLLAAITALGAGLWLSAMNVKYRDVHLLVPLLILIGMFVTPVVYPFSLVPEQLQPIYALNPMGGVLETYRWALLGTDWPGTLILIPVTVGVFSLISGLFYFQRAQRNFADVI